MKRLFRFRIFTFLIIALIIATITLISVNTSDNSGFITNALSSMSKPLKSVAATVAKAYESLYGYINQYETVKAENAELRAEISKLRQDYRESTDMAAEIERLRDLLDLGARHPDYTKFDTATVISWGASNWSSTFTIGKGSSNSDVKVGDCVITETGDLVGVVSDVKINTSDVITILDTTFSVGAYIERNDERRIATGDFALMKQGLLKLDYLQGTTDIIAGDTIITSGKDGILPAGLVIGTVKEVVTDNTGLNRYATIKPSVDIQSLANISLITSFEISEVGK